MFKTIAAFIAAIAIATPAIAAKRSINVPLTGFLVTGSAGLANAMITLPDSGVPSVSTQLVLPNDYKEGTPFYLRLNFDTGTVCNMNMLIMDVQRFRPGKQMSVTLGSAALVDGHVLSFPAMGVMARKTITVTTGNFTFFSGQKPGDTIYLQVVRNPGEASDTCTTVNMRSAEFRYMLR